MNRYQIYREILHESMRGSVTDDEIEKSLNYVKDNIIDCHNNTHPTNKVITELFKRGLAKIIGEKCINNKLKNK